MNMQRHFLLLATLAVITLASAKEFAPIAAPANPGAQSTASIPDFSGIWRHGNLPWFIPPASGPGPVRNLSREKGTGVSDYSSLVGDCKLALRTVVRKRFVGMAAGTGPFRFLV